MVSAPDNMLKPASDPQLVPTMATPPLITNVKHLTSDLPLLTT